MLRASSYRFSVGFAIAFALLISISVLDYQQNTVLVQDTSWVSHSYQVIALLSELAGAEDVAESEVQLAAATRVPDMIAVARSMIARVDPLLVDLRALTVDSVSQQQRLSQLEPLLQRHVAQFEAVLSGTDTSALQPTATEIDRLIFDMQQEEQQLLDLRTSRSLVSAQRTQWLIIGGDALGLLIGLGTGMAVVVALRARDTALSDLARLNRGLDAHVQQQTAALNIANAQLAALSHHLLTDQEAERATLAIALHEAIGQEIAALQLDLQLLDDASSDPAVRAQLNASMVAIDRLLELIRSLSFDLRPPMLDDFGLLEAIRATIEPHAAQAGIDFTLDAASLSKRLPVTVETACFRIAQDASALLLHAPGIRGLQIRLADRVDVIELAICGTSTECASLNRTLNSDRSTLALLEIRERAAATGGTITINTPTEDCTCIIVRVPLDAAPT